MSIDRIEEIRFYVVNGDLSPNQAITNIIEIMMTDDSSGVLETSFHAIRFIFTGYESSITVKDIPNWNEFIDKYRYHISN